VDLATKKDDSGEDNSMKSPEYFCKTYPKETNALKKIRRIYSDWKKWKIGISFLIKLLQKKIAYKCLERFGHISFI